MIEHQILSVTLMATGLEILPVEQRPQPVLVATMALADTGGRPSVTVMAGGATELLRIVQGQQGGIGVADKCFLASHVGPGQHHRLPDAQVTGFTAVHQVYIGHMDLPDLQLEVAHLFPQPPDLRGGQTGEAVVEQSIPLPPQLVGGLHQFRPLRSQLGPPGLQAVEFRLQLVEIEAFLPLHHLPGTVGGSQPQGHLAGLDGIDLTLQSVLILLAGGGFDLVDKGRDLAAGDGKGLGNDAQPPADDLVGLAVQIGDSRGNRLFGLGDRITQRPVLRRLADGLLGPGLGRLNPPQVPAVEADKLLLVVLPGSEAVGLIVQRPQQREDHQQR